MTRPSISIRLGAATCGATSSDSADNTPDLIAGILDALGQDGSRLVDLARPPDNKARLRRQTERAWELGIFGVPSFVVEGEMFWGQDRIEQAFDWSGSEPTGEPS